MKIENESVTMMDMFSYPVFCVQNGIISEANHYAQNRQINVGTPIIDLICDGIEEYEAFCGGCLSLSLQICGTPFIATVLHAQDKDVFHLRSEYDSPEFRTMALVSQQLRQPLADVMCLTDSLLPDAAIQADPERKQQAAQINRGLFKLLRQLSNLSAVSSFSRGRTYGKETRNITAIFDELFERAQALVPQTGRTLHCTGPAETVYSFVDAEMLEQAVFNMLSNAIKFSPAGSEIAAKLVRTGSKLRFSVENRIDPIGQEPQRSLFFRFLRDAEIEDGRNGLGLGIPLAQYAAASHGGTLLMDHPQEDTIRFTLTLQIQQSTGTLRSPVFQLDYLGGRDHSLVELSDVLPASAYEDVT